MANLLTSSILLARLVALAVLASSTLPFSTLAENRVSIGIVGGERSAHASAIEFGRPIYIDGQVVQTGTATIVVDDLSGTGAGWQVAIGLTGPIDSHQIETGQTVAILSVSAPLHVAGQEIDETGGPHPVDLIAGELRQSRILLTAKPGYGKGSYEAVVTIVRLLPVDPAAPIADLTLSVTIVAGR